MNPSDVHATSGEQIRQAASEAVSRGADIRTKVHELTLFALQRRRFDRHGFTEVVRAVTEGVVVGAEQSRYDMRRALADAFSGLDQAIMKSAEAGHAALRELAASGQNFSDNEFKQALANLRKIEDDFLDTVSLVAGGASEKVGAELGRILGSARTSGTQTGRQVAEMTGEFAQRFAAASLDVTIAGVQAAGVYGARFAALASGILSGIAEALRPPVPQLPDPTKEQTPPARKFDSSES